MNLKLKAKIVEKYGTQADFADVIDMDDSLISKIIRGRRKLNTEMQFVWAKALGCVFRRKLPPIPEITLPLIPPSNSLVECNTKVAGLRQLFGYIFLRESPSNSIL